jgi:Tetratricopeptide repeat
VDVSRLSRWLWMSILAVLALPVAAQPDAAAVFRDANALMRSGVYRTALLRYREAAAAGFDTPLLHYNMGVAHYRLDQYAAAAAEFQKAQSDPQLAPLATYNLGLVHRAAGDSAEAVAAFKAAADMADRRDLRRLAERAAAAPVANADAGTQRRVRPTLNRREPLGQFRFSVLARAGQDDNVYRAPADPYVDLSDSAQPTVTPVPQASTFMPVDLFARYLLPNEKGDTNFVFSYGLDGDFYPAEFSNATRFSQRLSMGADIVLGEREHRRRTLQSAFFVDQHQETNFDPDTGIDREINGTDISDRFSYVASGVQGAFRHRLGRWQWGFDLGFERRRYARVSQVSGYDHDYLHGVVSVDFDLRPSTTLSFGVRNYQRNYDTRPAYDLNGDLLTTNPALRYSYQGVQLGVRQRFGRIELDADLLRLDRTDAFEGYGDYAQSALLVRAIFRPGTRLQLSLSAVGRSYDYPRAFAFNDPAGGQLTLDGTSAQLAAEFRATRKLSVFVEVGVTDVTSTDSRIAYARTQSQIGVRWRR